MKALLLAAGKGTRLWPLTEVRAKAAVPYRGVPLVRRLAQMLLASGITGLAVNLHHLPETVRASLRGLCVSYSFEPELLGTSGALYPLRPVLEGTWFWTVNAKITLDSMPPLAPVPGSPVITAILAPAPPEAPYTRVDVSGSPCKVRGFRSPETHDGTGFLFTGVQLVGPGIWDVLPGPGFSHFTSDVYPRIWATGGEVGAYVTAQPWQEFSTLARYLAFHLTAEGSDVHWGTRARISRTARISESVVWDRVTVEPGARVHRCVLADGVTIRGRSSIDRAAVVPLAGVGADPRGTVVDDNLVVPIP